MNLFGIAFTKIFFVYFLFSFMDVQLQEDGGIPVVPFLEACKSVLTIFGKIFTILTMKF